MVCAGVGRQRVQDTSACAVDCGERTLYVSLNLGVLNVFNPDAPQTFAPSSIQVFGANTRYANLWGRTLQPGMKARF